MTFLWSTDSPFPRSTGWRGWDLIFEYHSYMKHIGVIVGRMQPPHLGHTYLIDQSLWQQDMTVIFLGSSNIHDENNPFSFDERKKMLLSKYAEEFDAWRVHIMWLADDSSDEVWFQNLITGILRLWIWEEDHLVFYGWDIEHDSAIQVIQWYLWNTWFHSFEYREMNRYTSHIQWLPVSSTRIRRALASKNMLEVQTLMDSEIFSSLQNILHHPYIHENDI